MMKMPREKGLSIAFDKIREIASWLDSQQLGVTSISSTSPSVLFTECEPELFLVLLLKFPFISYVTFDSTGKNENQNVRV